MAKEPKNKKESNRHFFKDFKAELKKVIWPTPKQVANNTTAVITIVLLTAIIVFALDVAFEKLNTHGIDKLRSVVTKNDNSISNEVDENTVQNNTIGEETTENNSTEPTSTGENNSISE